MLSHIRRVDIELQSYCNRKCPWCPNTKFSRDHKVSMTDDMYSKILRELKDNNFGTTQLFSNPEIDTAENIRLTNNQPMLTFLGYQEPMSNPDLLKKRVLQAWDVLPNHVELIAHTNGDFLTRENLDGLLLTTLNIMDYDNKGIAYWKKQMESLGMLVVDIDEDSECIIAIHRHMENVRCQCNWPKHARLENRGGFFKQGDLNGMCWRENMQERTMSCYEPSYFINIDYQGNVMPCCHMRTDNPAHKEFILGNVSEDTLVDIHNSDKANQLKKILSTDNGNYPDPCKYCQKIRGRRY